MQTRNNLLHVNTTTRIPLILLAVHPPPPLNLPPPPTPAHTTAAAAVPNIVCKYNNITAMAITYN